MVVEKVDDRAEAEGADYGSEADDSAAEEADQGTDDIVGHPAPEVGDVQAFVHDQGQGVVGGYAYVGALIHGETEAAYYDTDQDAQDSLPHLAGRDSGAESVVEEGCHVTVDKGIYNGSPADQMAAEDNFHNEDQKVDDHQKVCICHSQAVRQAHDHSVKGIISEAREFEDCHSHRQKYITGKHQQYAVPVCVFYVCCYHSFFFCSTLPGGFSPLLFSYMISKITLLLS